MIATEVSTQLSLTIDRKAFLRALQIVNGVVLMRSPKPVLTGVYLEAHDESITLAGTDLEQYIEFQVGQVEVEAPGKVLVPADRLLAIAKESDAPTLKLACGAKGLEVTDESGRFTLQTMRTEDWPPVPLITEGVEVVMQAEELVNAIQHTIYATARESSRYAINGVYFEGEKVVATDGHRLALYRAEVQAGIDGKTLGGIAPTKAMNLLKTSVEGEVRITQGEGKMEFRCEGFRLVTNLVGGNFPPYNDVIPKDTDKTLQVRREILIHALNQARLMTSDDSRGVRFACAPDKLTITSRAPELGESEINVPIEKYAGEAFEIGFDPNYILDALKPSDAEVVTLRFKAPNKPGVIETGSVYTAVIMPINLQ